LHKVSRPTQTLFTSARGLHLCSLREQNEQEEEQGMRMSGRAMTVMTKLCWRRASYL
jgi:hypothetical protein